MTLSRPNRATALLVFVGTFLTYAALTPGTIAGMGYTSEEMHSGDSIMAALQARLSGRPALPIKLSRNGFLPVVLDLPFQAAGKRIVSEDFILSMEPMLDTALLVTILFVWLRKLTSPGLAVCLALSAAFGTLLWPYAYIGLETKQSLFLLLSAYLALEGRPIQSFGRAIVFGLCCALAIGSKANGLMLLPAVTYLAYAQFREGWRQRLPFALTTLAVAGTLSFANSAARAQYYLASGVTTFVQFRSTMIDSVFQYLGSLIGLFGSPTKGLLLYAPLILLSLYAVPCAWRVRRDLTLFVLLTVGGLVGGFALVAYYADETWGARYLHSCVAPLVLLIGASRSRFSWRDAAMIPLTALGVVISFLGAFYYYGNMHAASIRAGENNLAELVGDANWNQITFNARLFAIWWESPPGPVLWTPTQRWMWEIPPDAPPAKTINLAEWAQPQSLLLRSWNLPRKGYLAVGWVLLLLAGLIGPTMLVIAGLWCRPPPDVADRPVADLLKKIEAVAKLPVRVLIPVLAGGIFLGLIFGYWVHSPVWQAPASVPTGSPASSIVTPKLTVPPGQAAVGYLDMVDDKTVISVAGGNQVQLSGWAACTDPASPLAEVEVLVDGRPVTNATLSRPRPDVGAAYNRPDFNNSGWQADFSAKGIKAGTHQLSARPTCTNGESATLPAFQLIVRGE